MARPEEYFRNEPTFATSDGVARGPMGQVEKLDPATVVIAVCVGISLGSIIDRIRDRRK